MPRATPGEVRRDHHTAGWGPLHTPALRWPPAGLQVSVEALPPTHVWTIFEVFIFGYILFCFPFDFLLLTFQHI